MKQLDITVAVPTYNNAKMLRGALASLISQETNGQFSYEILVIDNRSSDDTPAIVSDSAIRSLVPVRYVCEEHPGLAYARNRGISETRSNWIAWFDDDQLVANDWLKNLFGFAVQMGADCASGTMLLDLPLEQQFSLGPVCRSQLSESIYREAALCRGKYLPGCGHMLMSRRVFDSIGLFDTAIMWAAEDTDFLLRARAAGFTIWVTPNAVVHHVILGFRLEPAYLRWVSLRWGCGFAHMDWNHRGPGAMLLLCVARIGQALVINTPRLMLAYMRGDNAEILDRQCLVLRAIGYMRRTLFLIAPRLFAQRRFFAALELRKQRKTFQGDSSLPPKNTVTHA